VANIVCLLEGVFGEFTLNIVVPAIDDDDDEFALLVLLFEVELLLGWFRKEWPFDEICWLDDVRVLVLVVVVAEEEEEGEEEVVRRLLVE
jgi:hypothetical protein